MKNYNLFDALGQFSLMYQGLLFAMQHAGYKIEAHDDLVAITEAALALFAVREQSHVEACDIFDESFSYFLDLVISSREGK